MRPERSSGGLVIREIGGRRHLAVIHTRNGAVALPKGHGDRGESAADAALREVREETGVTAEVVEKLGDVTYWYQREGRRQLKVVSFFLMRYLSGDVADHDHEVESADWIPLHEAPKQLTYAGERDMAERALAKEGGVPEPSL